MLQLETPAGPSSTLTGTAGRSEKRQKLTATSSRRLEDTNQEEIYVINPDRNQGKNYTFHSVQRNKEQRRCMHGEACEGCDNWYEATKDIQPDGGIQFGRYSPTPSQLIEEDQEELAQARKQKIMNNVSRHKVEHEKNPTPPGYWAPGFPSTAVVQQQNEEADAMQQVKRDKQRKEAEKPDGKWKVLGRESPRNRTPRAGRRS